MHLPSEGFEKQLSRIIFALVSVKEKRAVSFKYSLTGAKGFAFGQRLLLFQAGPYCNPRNGPKQRRFQH
eukprot:s207_g36.t1